MHRSLTNNANQYPAIPKTPPLPPVDQRRFQTVGEPMTPPLLPFQLSPNPEIEPISLPEASTSNPAPTPDPKMPPCNPPSETDDDSISTEASLVPVATPFRPNTPPLLEPRRSPLAAPRLTVVRRMPQDHIIQDLLSRLEELGRDNGELVLYCRGARDQLDECRAYCHLLQSDAFQHAQNIKVVHDTKSIYLKANQILTNQNREHHIVQQELSHTQKKLTKQAFAAEDEMERCAEDLARLWEQFHAVERERDELKREPEKLKQELDQTKDELTTSHADTKRLQNEVETLRARNAILLADKETAERERLTDQKRHESKLDDIKEELKKHKSAAKETQRLLQSTRISLKLTKQKLQRSLEANSAKLAVNSTAGSQPARSPPKRPPAPSPVSPPASRAPPEDVVALRGPFGLSTKQTETLAPVSANKHPSPTIDDSTAPPKEPEPVPSTLVDVQGPDSSSPSTCTSNPASAPQPVPKKRKMEPYVLLPHPKDLAEPYISLPIKKKRKLTVYVEIPPYRP